MSEADTIYKHIPPTIDEELKLYKNYVACEYHKRCAKEEMDNVIGLGLWVISCYALFELAVKISEWKRRK